MSLKQSVSLKVLVENDTNWTVARRKGYPNRLGYLGTLAEQKVANRETGWGRQQDVDEIANILLMEEIQLTTVWMCKTLLTTG